MKRILLLRLGSCGLFVAAMAAIVSPAASGKKMPDARAIVKASDQSLKPHTEKILYRMTLVAPGGSVEQVRTFFTYYKNRNGEERTLQKFLSPPVLAGTGLLLIDHGKADTNIWMYLPTTRRIRRIAGHEKSNQYMGTEFCFEDFEGYQISAYDFNLLGEKPSDNGNPCWVIEAVAATPSQKAATGYAKKHYWIDQNTYYPLRVEYYAKDGSLEKVLTAHDLHQVDRYWRPRREEMKNLHSGRSTRLVLEKIQIDQPLADKYVSERYLRRD